MSPGSGDSHSSALSLSGCSRPRRAACSACLVESQHWQALARTFSPDHLKVVLVLVRTAPSEVPHARNTLGWTQQILLDSTGQIDRELRLPEHTPFKVLLDQSAADHA